MIEIMDYTEEPKYSFKDADEFFGKAASWRKGTTVWVPGRPSRKVRKASNTVNYWMDSDSGELLLAKEPKMPAGAKLDT
jgi:hypothetical protein